MVRVVTGCQGRESAGPHWTPLKSLTAGVWKEVRAESGESGESGEWSGESGELRAERAWGCKGSLP